MNLNLNHRGFENYLVRRKPINICGVSGVVYVFRFENNYGAAVVKDEDTRSHDGSYGYEKDLWELAVVKFDDNSDNWHITYDTDIAKDIVGYLTDEDVRDLLARIKEL